VINIFERKVLRKIYGPVLVNGQWRNRQNHEIYKFHKGNELTRNIRLRRFQWVGHVMGMMDETVSKKALKSYAEWRRPVGRPRRRRLFDLLNLGSGPLGPDAPRPLLTGPCSGQGC
jgi:hypothetical protein